MAKKTTAPETLVINQIRLIQLQRQKAEIDRWRNALRSAESVTNPLRRPLLELYRELMLDAHLYAIVDKRIRAVTRRRFSYVEDDVDTSEINRMFASPWFSDVVWYAMEALFWGFSLVELHLDKGMVAKAVPVPRQHVRPELGIVVLANASETAGIEYRKPPYDTRVLEVWLEDELGLLNIAAANVIYKRGGTTDYANFIEMFGSPIRQYEYDPNVPGAREETQKVADESGNSAAIVTPRDWTTLTLHQVNNSVGASVHSTFLADLKEELSVLVLGNTMTTEDGSSLSQAKVHQDEQTAMTQDDVRFVEDVLNFHLKPKLEALGYPVAKGRFQADQTDTTPIEVKLDMDLKMKAAGIPIDDDYFYDKYKIPKPTGAGRKAAAPEKKKPEPAQSLLTFHAADCTCGGLPTDLALPTGLFKSILKVFRRVFDKQLKAGDIDEQTFTDTYQALVDGIGTGYGDIRPDYETPDTQMLARLQEQTGVFAAHKNAAFVKALAEALTGADGKLVEWNDFRKIARNIHADYNVNWLRTEYNQAVASAQMASRWVEIEAAKADFPNLKYSTVGDANVRPAHAKLDGVVRPVDDAFWDAAYPPSAWSCRCTVQQLDDTADITPESRYRSVLSGPDWDKRFNGNVGKTGKPFGEDYEYYLSLTPEQRKAAEQKAKEILEKDNGND
jgi:SPP1 gp7 family putative phage head morphogenesis protein